MRGHSGRSLPPASSPWPIASQGLLLRGDDAIAFPPEPGILPETLIGRHSQGAFRPPIASSEALDLGIDKTSTIPSSTAPEVQHLISASGSLTDITTLPHALRPRAISPPTSPKPLSTIDTAQPHRSGADLLRALAAVASQAQFSAHPITDSESSIGVLEQHFASLCGFEKALFVPTPTVAHLAAVKIHSDDRLRATKVGIHITSDLIHSRHRPIESVWGFDIVTVGSMTAPIDFDTVKRALLQAKSLGSIVFELPQLSLGGLIPPLAELEAMTGLAQRFGVRCHLDGSHLFRTLAAYFPRTPAELCFYFDSAFISAQELFGAATGGFLMGTERFINQARLWVKRLGAIPSTNIPFEASIRLSLLNPLLSPTQFVLAALKMRRVASVFEDMTPWPFRFDPPQPQCGVVHVIFRAPLCTVLDALLLAQHKAGAKVRGSLRLVPFFRTDPENFAPSPPPDDAVPVEPRSPSEESSSSPDPRFRTLFGFDKGTHEQLTRLQRRFQRFREEPSSRPSHALDRSEETIFQWVMDWRESTVDVERFVEFWMVCGTSLAGTSDDPKHQASSSASSFCSMNTASRNVHHGEETDPHSVAATSSRHGDMLGALQAMQHPAHHDHQSVTHGLPESPVSSAAASAGVTELNGACSIDACALFSERYPPVGRDAAVIEEMLGSCNNDKGMGQGRTDYSKAARAFLPFSSRKQREECPPTFVQEPEVDLEIEIGNDGPNPYSGRIPLFLPELVRHQEASQGFDARLTGPLFNFDTEPQAAAAVSLGISGPTQPSTMQHSQLEDVIRMQSIQEELRKYGFSILPNGMPLMTAPVGAKSRLWEASPSQTEHIRKLVRELHSIGAALLLVRHLTQNGQHSPPQNSFAFPPVATASQLTSVPAQPVAPTSAPLNADVGPAESEDQHPPVPKDEDEPHRASKRTRATRGRGKRTSPPRRQTKNVGRVAGEEESLSHDSKADPPAKRAKRTRRARDDE
jgi:hypothetical protein